jgi:phytoene dehydrogenase-like protein
MQNNQIIVIGAGIAGLVAAYELKKAGCNVTVLESSSKSGGRMSSDKSDSFIIDTGAQFLSSGYPILSGLIKEFELKPHFVPTNPYCGIVRQSILAFA